jgi:lysine-arginine-ornithine-binding protein
MLQFNRRLRLFVAVLAVFAFVLVAAGCGQTNTGDQTKNEGDQEQPKEKIVIGTDATYPPMEFHEQVNGQDVINGFDIDIGKALAEEMGMEVEFEDTGWDGIIPALLAGQFDMIMSSMTITDERKQQVNFSDPYFNAGQVIAVRNDDDSIKSIDDLVGKTVAVQIGTTGDLLISETEGVDVQRFNTIVDAFMELKNKRADAVFNDLPVAQDYVRKGEPIKIVGEPLTDEYYGIAIRKDNTELLEKVNKAIKALKDSGKYQEILDKWFEQ